MAKLRRFFPLFLLLALLACTEKIELRIPYRRVSLRLYLDFQDKALRVPQSYKIYTNKNVDEADEYTGFGGVLVYHGIAYNGTEYHAFDAACPHEAMPNVIVNVDETGIFAICPKCGSKFDLLEGFGIPVAGPCAEERQPLKRYKVEQEKNKIYIFN